MINPKWDMHWPRTKQNPGDLCVPRIPVSLIVVYIHQYTLQYACRPTSKPNQCVI